jgi:hypothetical protein
VPVGLGSRLPPPEPVNAIAAAMDTLADSRKGNLAHLPSHPRLRPGPAVEFLLTFQPAIGSADAPQDVDMAHGADLAGEPEEAEAEAVRWVPADEAHPTAGRFSCAHSVQLRACSNDLDGA